MPQQDKYPMTPRRLRRRGSDPRPAEQSFPPSAWLDDSNKPDHEFKSDIFDEYLGGEGNDWNAPTSSPTQKSDFSKWLPLILIAVAGSAAFYRTIINGLAWASIGALAAAVICFIAVLVWWCWRVCGWLRKRGWSKAALLLAFVLAAAIIFFCSVMVVSAMASQPKYDKIINEGVTNFLPHTDHLIYRTRDGVNIYNAEGRMVGAEEISQSRLKYAILSIEDERYLFRFEGPIDFVATMRAIVMTVVRRRRQGGSTIQLQVAKMLMGLQRVGLEDKDVQTLLAFRLEQRITDPDEMLALYANLCQINGDRRGIADAAYNFFGVSDLRQLTIEQAALLAALLKSPTAFSPRTHPQAARERRDLVLFKMRELGHITEQEYQAAVRTEIRVEPNLNRNELLIRAANTLHGVSE